MTPKSRGAYQPTIPPRDKDDHVNAKSVQPPTHARSRFGLRAPGKGCSIHPVIARSAKTSEMQEHGERFAHLANLLEAEPLIEAPGVVVHLHTQAHRNEIVFAGRGNQRLE